MVVSDVSPVLEISYATVTMKWENKLLAIQLALWLLITCRRTPRRTTSKPTCMSSWADDLDYHHIHWLHHGSLHGFLLLLDRNSACLPTKKLKPYVLQNYADLLFAWLLLGGSWNLLQILVEHPPTFCRGSIFKFLSGFDRIVIEPVLRFRWPVNTQRFLKVRMVRCVDLPLHDVPTGFGCHSGSAPETHGGPPSPWRFWLQVLRRPWVCRLGTQERRGLWISGKNSMAMDQYWTINNGE